MSNRKLDDGSLTSATTRVAVFAPSNKLMEQKVFPHFTIASNAINVPSYYKRKSIDPSNAMEKKLSAGVWWKAYHAFVVDVNGTTTSIVSRPGFFDLSANAVYFRGRSGKK